MPIREDDDGTGVTGDNSPAEAAEDELSPLPSLVLPLLLLVWRRVESAARLTPLASSWVWKKKYAGRRENVVEV